MKSCPACNRTFDDTMVFCLEDGSILSAPNDSNKTEQIPALHTNDSVLTRISYPAAKSSNSTQPPMPTRPSPQIPTDYIQKDHYQDQAKRLDHKIRLGVGALALLAITAVSIIVWINAGKPAPDNSNVAKNQNVTRTNSNGDFQENRKPATEFGAMDYHASLNGENLTYYPGTTPEQCQADCAKNAKCKGFTFIRAGAYNPNDSAMCYLASAVTGTASHACCISAIKR